MFAKLKRRKFALSNMHAYALMAPKLPSAKLLQRWSLFSIHYLPRKMNIFAYLSLKLAIHSTKCSSSLDRRKMSISLIRKPIRSTRHRLIHFVIWSSRQTFTEFSKTFTYFHSSCSTLPHSFIVL